MSDIKASLSLEFALRTESALKSLTEIEDKISNIESSLAKLSVNMAPTVGPAATPATAVATAGAGAQEVENVGKFATASKEALAAVREVYREENKLFDLIKKEREAGNIADDQAIKQLLKRIEVDKELEAEIKAITESLNKMYTADKKELGDQLNDLKIVAKYWQEHENRVRIHTKLIEGLGAVLGPTMSGFVKNLKENGRGLATATLMVDFLGKAWSDADKLLQHFSSGMFKASENGVALAMTVSNARRVLGATTDEVIKAADAVLLAGITTADTNEHVSAAIVQVGRLAKAYGVGEEASAAFMAIQTGVSGKLEIAGGRIEELARALSNAGLSASESTEIFSKSAKMTLFLDGVFHDAGKAGMSYAKTYIEIAKNAKLAKVPVEALAEVLETTTRGGAEAIMLMGNAAFENISPADAYAAALNNLGEIQARLANLPSFLKKDPAIIKSLTGLSLEAFTALEKEAEIRKRIAEDPAFAEKYEEEKSLADAWNTSVQSGQEGIKRLGESLSALLGPILIPINKALGLLANLLQRIVGVATEIGDYFEKHMPIVAGGVKQAGSAMFGLLIVSRAFSALRLGKVFEMMNPMPLVRGIFGLKDSLKSLVVEGGGITKFFTSMKDKMYPAAKSAEQLTTATSKMTPATGVSAKGFLEKFADGLTALSKVPAKNLAMVLLILAGAFIIIGGTILAMAVVIKKFGLTASDFLTAALGMALAAGVMIGAVALFGLLGAEVTALAPLLLMAALAIAVLGASMLLAGIATTKFADAFSTVMEAWDVKKAFELLGWMVLAGPAIAIFGSGMLIASPGLIIGSIGLIAAAVGLGLLRAVITDSLPNALMSIGLAMIEMAIGMASFAVVSLPFLASVMTISMATNILSAAMLVFPNKWFRHAAISMDIWSKAIQRLPERSAAKISGIKDVLKELKNLPNLNSDAATETAKALAILTPRISEFADAAAELTGIGAIGDQFAAAVDKIAAAMIKLKGFSEADFNASVAVVKAINIDSTAVGTPLSTTKFNTTAPYNAENGTSRVEEILIASKQILSEIKADALDRGNSLKDILNHLKNNLPDGYLGTSSLTREASDW